MMAALAATAMTLGELLGVSAGSHRATEVRDLVVDSRAAHEGAAFVAVQGGREHGLRYAADALARGAAVVLFDPAEVAAPGADVAERGIAVPRLAARFGELAGKLYGPAMAHVELAGVTGTNGKTTVAYLVAQAMTRLGKRCGYTGTLGYGVPPELTTHALTTPDCFTLHRELAAIAEHGAAHAALEVSSHALAQDRIAGLAFHTAAFTNLTRDHLDAHGSFDAYADAKARLFTLAGLKHAVLNVNDAFAARFASALSPAVALIRVALQSPRLAHATTVAAAERAGAARGGAGNSAAYDAELSVSVRTLGLGGVELAIEGAYGTATLRSPLVGEFNAENLLVALGMLMAWRVPLGDACVALGKCSAPPGRLEVVRPDRASAPWVVVDYAHTPDGLKRVLEALKSIGAGDVWCVFGCGGERDRGKRAPMGAIATAHADHLVITDDNPRGEDPKAIVRDILAGIDADSSVVVEHDRGAAIARAIHAARPGDVVLIAGKGHESSQLIGGVERPFSDRQAALAALGARV
jgi:UDP-N-acetylmuramoyl-L-alanyl-D-glutamate--2,6-diaminopimelate ligase